MCYYTCTQLRHVLKYVASTYTLSAAHTLYVVGQITLHSLSVMLDYVTCGEWFLIPWGKDQCSHKVSGSSQKLKQTIPNLLAPTSILLLLHNATVGAGARDYPNPNADSSLVDNDYVPNPTQNTVGQHVISLS